MISPRQLLLLCEGVKTTVDLHIPRPADYGRVRGNAVKIRARAQAHPERRLEALARFFAD